MDKGRCQKCNANVNHLYAYPQPEREADLKNNKVRWLCFNCHVKAIEKEVKIR